MGYVLTSTQTFVNGCLNHLGHYPHTFGMMSHELQGRLLFDWFAGAFTPIWNFAFDVIVKIQ
jgi:hypothetical protein